MTPKRIILVRQGRSAAKGDPTVYSHIAAMTRSDDGVFALSEPFVDSAYLSEGDVV